MKKLILITSSLFIFSACVSQENEVVKSNLMNLALQTALNPSLKDEQTNCITNKNASSCLNIANVLLQGTSTSQNIQAAGYYYQLACSFGLAIGCDKANELKK
ncbi:SEL1-like repeat protein [Campylobacter sp. RM12640]|uniref:SEL1-like repeat protein n=1 Tax=unclassified Campylobacter TaxID=2593542 RepID=UPI001DEAE73A|nr:SEL1-like repeat protein [Campylobacter sp. RM12637]MBZ7981520.1 SEL1-like repeat protein [Campylobacter sp. RM12640]MBZ7983562.1 SEL1-like repeat protein [Campylobacter sp. RM12647]MBZ7989055.1 SEL1-like repeat protein [Campylobacter sp. RM12635]